MFDVGLVVSHDHCARCADEAPLFILVLRPGEEPALKPKPDNVHAGCCASCWRGLAWSILGASWMVAPIADEVVA